MLLDADDLIEAIQKVKPKIVFFSNPCNPTGQIIKREKVLKIVSSTDAIVVCDEAYMDFANESVAGEIDKFKNLIVTRTLSKAGGIASARVGFALSNADIIKMLKTAKSPYNVNTLSQIFAKALLKNEGEINGNVAKLVEARNNLYLSLASLKTVLGSQFRPLTTFANFVCVITSKAQKIKNLLAEQGIAIRAFKDMIRISAGNENDIDELMQVLKNNP
jgi:histidinol-phosphate aminotransferase